MPSTSVVTAPVTAPPPPAYPDPITLPVSPHGDPTSARLLADAYRALAADLDRAGAHVDAIVGDLALRWHGQGASALRLPRETLDHNLRTVAASCRSAAGHLDDYATALHKAQHHHGWSLGKLVAVGAIVTVTAVAVVVTVGAAAPVGTVAAMEVGEAIVGAEAAAGAASAAEVAATEGLSLAGQSMGALRGLVAVALPHLAQGAVSSGIDLGLHLATGRAVIGRDLGESFLAGTLMSGTAATTRSALRASETYAGASAAGKAALDTAALTATLTADTALGQYAATGHVNPTALTEDALLTALTGGASTLRHPLDGTGAIAKPVSSGQSIADLQENGVHIQIHEGPEYPWGHAITRHVGLTESDLAERLKSDKRLRFASTFSDMAALKGACDKALRDNPQAVADVMSGKREDAKLIVRFAEPLGAVLPRGGRLHPSSSARIIIVRVGDNLVVRTAFVEAS